MTELTAVVVGCGAVGSDYDAGREGKPPLSHAGAYRAHEATELVAGVDRHPEARRRFEDRWGVPAYEELGAALAEHGPALVSICTPVETHLEVVREAVAGGRRESGSRSRSRRPTRKVPSSSRRPPASPCRSTSCAGSTRFTAGS